MHQLTQWQSVIFYMIVCPGNIPNFVVRKWSENALSLLPLVCAKKLKFPNLEKNEFPHQTLILQSNIAAKSAKK